MTRNCRNFWATSTMRHLFCAGVEREFLRLLGGGCNLPLGIRTSLSGRKLRCEAIVFDESNLTAIRELFRANSDTPQAAASALLKQDL